MNIFGMLLGGPAERHETTGEPFSYVENSDDYCAGEWADLIVKARANGVTVEFTTKGIKMRHGKSEGLFRDAKGGVRLAEAFLEEIT